MLNAISAPKIWTRRWVVLVRRRGSFDRFDRFTRFAMK